MRCAEYSASLRMRRWTRQGCWVAAGKEGERDVNEHLQRNSAWPGHWQSTQWRSRRLAEEQEVNYLLIFPLRCGESQETVSSMSKIADKKTEQSQMLIDEETLLMISEKLKILDSVAALIWHQMFISKGTLNYSISFLSLWWFFISMIK